MSLWNTMLMTHLWLKNGMGGPGRWNRGYMERIVTNYKYSGGGRARSKISKVAQRTRIAPEVFSIIEMGFVHIGSAPRTNLPKALVALPLLELFYDRKVVCFCKVSIHVNESYLTRTYMYFLFAFLTRINLTIRWILDQLRLMKGYKKSGRPAYGHRKYPSTSVLCPMADEITHERPVVSSPCCGAYLGHTSWESSLTAKREFGARWWSESSLSQYRIDFDRPTNTKH